MTPGKIQSDATGIFLGELSPDWEVEKRKQGKPLREVSHCSRTSQGQEAGARLCSLEAHRERVPSLLHYGKETALTAGASDGIKATPASGMAQSDGGDTTSVFRGLPVKGGKQPPTSGRSIR